MDRESGGSLTLSSAAAAATTPNTATSSTSIIRPTEAQLRWFQFHHKHVAERVKESVQRLWLQPSEVAVASNHNNNTEDDDPQLLPLSSSLSHNCGIIISRGRQALLRQSQRLYEQRKQQISENGYRQPRSDEKQEDDSCCSSPDDEDDDDDSMGLNSLSTCSTATTRQRHRRMMMHRRRWVPRDGDPDRILRFKAAYRAAMESLAEAADDVYAETTLTSVHPPCSPSSKSSRCNQQWTKQQQHRRRTSFGSCPEWDTTTGSAVGSKRQESIHNPPSISGIAPPMDRRATWLNYYTVIPAKRDEKSYNSRSALSSPIRLQTPRQQKMILSPPTPTPQQDICRRSGNNNTPMHRTKKKHKPYDSSVYIMTPEIRRHVAEVARGVFKSHKKAPVHEEEEEKDGVDDATEKDVASFMEQFEEHIMSSPMDGSSNNTASPPPAEIVHTVTYESDHDEKQAGAVAESLSMDDSLLNEDSHHSASLAFRHVYESPIKQQPEVVAAAAATTTPFVNGSTASLLGQASAEAVANCSAARTTTTLLQSVEKAEGVRKTSPVANVPSVESLQSSDKSGNAPCNSSPLSSRKIASPSSEGPWLQQPLPSDESTMSSHLISMIVKETTEEEPEDSDDVEGLWLIKKTDMKESISANGPSLGSFLPNNGTSDVAWNPTPLSSNNISLPSSVITGPQLLPDLSKESLSAVKSSMFVEESLEKENDDDAATPRLTVVEEATTVPIETRAENFCDVEGTQVAECLSNVASVEPSLSPFAAVSSTQTPDDSKRSCSSSGCVSSNVKGPPLSAAPTVGGRSISLLPPAKEQATMIVTTTSNVKASEFIAPAIAVSTTTTSLPVFGSNKGGSRSLQCRHQPVPSSRNLNINSRGRTSCREISTKRKAGSEVCGFAFLEPSRQLTTVVDIDVNNWEKRLMM